MDKYQKAIDEAISRLKKDSRDSAHNLAHHQAVWKNCEEILSFEKININKNLLKVAVYWHDVILSEPKWPSKLNVQETISYLKQILPTYKFDSNEIKVITNTILYHEFRDTPTTLEGLVLQDADKLEVLSEKRWNIMFDDYKKEKISKETITSYLKTFLKWSTLITATFHFSYAKEKAIINLNRVWSESKWQILFTDFGLKHDFHYAKKARNSFKIQVFRFIVSLKSFFLKFFLNIKYQY